MNTTEILLRNNLVSLPTNRRNTKVDAVFLATLISNIRYYGYTLSKETLNILMTSTQEVINQFWKDLEPALKIVTGTNRNMEKFVVYKNFPKEVLNMSQTQYWISQIFMYLGVPNEYFTEDEKSRPAMLENTTVKILHLSKKNSLATIARSLVQNSSRWSDNQEAMATYFMFNKEHGLNHVKISDFKFRENAIVLICRMIFSVLNITQNAKTKTDYNIVILKNVVNIGDEYSFKIEDATDVLRLAAGLSAGDISLRENVRFVKFNRMMRRMFTKLLENTKNLDDDFATRPESWKNFLKFIHPGEFKATRVSAAYDKLYNKSHPSFSAQITPQIKTEKILDVIKIRPGEFARRLHDMYANFGSNAIDAFNEVADALKTDQLLKLAKYVETINTRSTLIYPPKGNWSRAQIVPNKKVKFKPSDKENLLNVINSIISSRINQMFPNGINLDSNTNKIKLQTNDQKLAEYGRGTSFDIPKNIKFIRSASYWENKSHGNSWFDNGWNFFGYNWEALGACAWNQYTFHDGAAIFSGDPTNTKDLKGRACQMIDLYPDKLLASGVRYAVWNILCYSKVKFSDATDVLATLQMGDKAEKGKLYEPSRAQMIFPLKSKNFSSYVAYIDLLEKKLVYMDAPLKADVQSAGVNSNMLATTMPAYIEYLNSQPSVYDIFAHAKTGTTRIMYSDKDVKIKKKAYVFRPENDDNKFENIKLQDLIV